MNIQIQMVSLFINKAGLPILFEKNKWIAFINTKIEGACLACSDFSNIFYDFVLSENLVPIGK